MDEELWLDYYYDDRDEDEPDRDNDELKEQDVAEHEPKPEHEQDPEREPEADQKIKSPQPQQDTPERRRWGYRDGRSRITDRRARVTRRATPQKAPVIYQLPTPSSRERRRTSPADQIIMLALLNIKQLRDPDQKKRSIYFGRVYELKDQDKLAPSTAQKYERETRSLKSLMQQYSNEEMFIHIAQLAVNKSRSTYFRQKAILERILTEQETSGDRSGVGLLRMLRHMPDYHRIRHIYGLKVEKSKETDKRRNAKIGLDAVKEYMREVRSKTHPMMQLVPLILYHTGARVSEVQQMKIYAEPNGEMTVRIRSVKTGCARKAPATRTVTITDKQICALLRSNNIGITIHTPFADIPTQTIRNNLLAARRRLSRRGIDVPSPHYFRHDYATRQRAAGVSNEDLRRQLGHTNQETTRQYGGGNIRVAKN